MTQCSDEGPPPPRLRTNSQRVTCVPVHAWVAHGGGAQGLHLLLHPGKAGEGCLRRTGRSALTGPPAPALSPRCFLPLVLEAPGEKCGRLRPHRHLVSFHLWDPLCVPVPSFPGFQVGLADERHWQKTAVEDGRRQVICNSVPGSSYRSGCITFLVSVSAGQHLLAGRHWLMTAQWNGLPTLACFLDLITLPPLVA